MFKFLHTADIHLDSPLLNLDRYDGAPVEAFRSATRRALDNVVALAVAERVRFVLIAGDLYDGDCRDFNTPLHFRRKMEELAGHGIRVFICQGNHDAQSGMRKAFRLQLPENVHLFRTDRSETIRIDELQVAVHGQGFAQKAVERDLSADYPDPVAGWLNIGLLHTSCGTYEGHDRYAPSSIAGLTSKGYQYWALGHIHQRETLAGPDPWIIYPGNTQGRHIREQGAKGCVLATVTGGRIATEFRPGDVLRWQSCTVDASPCSDADEVIAEAVEAIEAMLASVDGRPAAVRLELVGASRAHRELTRHADYWDRRLREAVVDRFDDRVWIEKIKIRTRAVPDLTGIGESDSALAELAAGIRDVASAHAVPSEVRDEFRQMLKQIPTDPRLSEDGLDLDDEHAMERLLDDAKELLIGRLWESGEPP
jgi:exonuclease SbcD